MSRFRFAATAGAVHLLASGFVAICCAALVFWLWYPFPFSRLAGGQELFYLVIVIDVVCGPLLTFIVYSPLKSRRELLFDISVVVLLQSLALCYGLYSVVQARPIFLAFEGDQFRVVSLPDIQFDDIDSAPENLRVFSFSGPILIGVRLASPSDNDFLRSIQLALNGVPPAFRPSRWMDFRLQSQAVIEKAKPFAELRLKHPLEQGAIEKAILNAGSPEEELGYLPLSAVGGGEWVVVVSLVDGFPRLYLPLSGW